MPSPVAHALAGLAAGWLVAGRPHERDRADAARRAALFAALGALPDVDLFLGAHSGPTHSIGAAAIVGGVAVIAATRSRPMTQAVRIGLACCAAYLSHVLLDWLGTDASPPIGIMALWPFSHAYFESNLHVFMAVSRRYYQGWPFVVHNAHAVLRELLILVPLVAAVYVVRSRSRVVVP
jgi:membrane-bound metal-dependent hydrolase YbcI (DUF457 family)